MEKPIIPILMYHSIQPVPKTEVMRSLHVHPRSFALQMSILKLLGYRGCSISEAVGALRSGSTERLVALTFDDGYKNFLSNALPTLQRYKFSGTVYVVSDLVDTFNRWDENKGITRNDLMNFRDLEFCSSEGIEIGCHSASHLSLTGNGINLTHEIKLAKLSLENNLGCSIDSFCYPFGHFNKQTEQAVKDYGFKSATTMTRSKASALDNVFRLPRIPITWHTLPHLFITKILTNYENRRRNI